MSVTASLLWHAWLQLHYSKCTVYTLHADTVQSTVLSDRTQKTAAVGVGRRFILSNDYRYARRQETSLSVGPYIMIFCSRSRRRSSQ